MLAFATLISTTTVVPSEFHYYISFTTFQIVRHSSCLIHVQRSTSISYLLKSLIQICLPRYLSFTSSLLLSLNLLTFQIAVEWVGLGWCSLVGLALIRLQLLNIQVLMFKGLRFQYIHPLIS